MSQSTNYIQKELEKGFSEKLITKKLLDTGYTTQEIKESFMSIKKGQPLLQRTDPIHSDSHVQWSRWVFPLLAILVVLFLGYLIFLYAIGQPLIGNIATDCDGIVDGKEKDLCFLQLAAAGEDVCRMMSSELLRAACQTRIWERDDCSYEMIVGKDWKECRHQKALETGDVTYCFELDEQQNACVYEIAAYHHDVAVCGANLGCVMTFAVDEKKASYCEYIPQESREHCYDLYTEQTSDRENCDKGSFICGYTALTTEKEKKAFIEDFLPLLDNTLEEERDYSVRDEELAYYAERYEDPLFCDYIQKVYYDECVGLIE